MGLEFEDLDSSLISATGSRLFPAFPQLCLHTFNQACASVSLPACASVRTCLCVSVSVCVYVCLCRSEADLLWNLSLAMSTQMVMRGVAGVARGDCQPAQGRCAGTGIERTGPGRKEDRGGTGNQPRTAGEAARPRFAAVTVPYLLLFSTGKLKLSTSVILNSLF